VLPWISAVYFLIFLGCLLAFVMIVEFRLSMLAAEGRVVSDEWQVENQAINRMNFAKVKSSTDHDPFWRSDGIPDPGPKGRKQRILVVGDSFVWGDGYLNANDIWWRQLERELRHRGYFGVEVVAAGFPGASTQDELRWLRDDGLLERLAPDAVVLGYVTNDPDVKGPDGKSLVLEIDEVATPTWDGLGSTLGRVAPQLTAQLKQNLTRKWQSKLVGAYAYDEWELKLLEPPNIDAYRDVVRQLGEFVKKSGKPFVAVTLPNWPSRERFASRYQPIAPIFSSAGLTFFNVLDDFLREYPPGGEVLQWGVNPANGHPGTVATRFYAREVTDLLERDYREVLGPREAVKPTLVPSINDWMPPTANLRQFGAGDWEFVYPASGSLAPTLPIGKPHVMVAFAEPVAIRLVRITGENLTGGELYMTSVDAATGVERKRHIELGSRSSKTLEWTVTPSPETAQVNTLKLAASLEPRASDAKARSLRLHVDFDEPPVRP
jgi:hypothetical protein